MYELGAKSRGRFLSCGLDCYYFYEEQKSIYQIIYLNNIPFPAWDKEGV